MGSITRLDLHRFTVQEAKQAVIMLFLEAAEKDVSQFYIITGRGNHENNGRRGVLKKWLPKFLKAYAAEIEEINAETGAFLVKLNLPHTFRNKQLKEIIFSYYAQAEEDVKAHIKNLKKAAQHNDAEALFALGLIYIHGFLEDFNDKEEGIKLLERAIKGEQYAAANFLGTFFLEGEGEMYQPQRGVQYYQRAVEAGDVDAKFLLAKCYLLGQGIYLNDKNGLDLMQQAADAGHVDACFNLGRSFLEKKFTAHDPGQGVKYLSKAAFKGHASALSRLARCYATGEGVEQHDRMALSLYLKAAEMNDVYALHQVGYYHHVGRAINKPDPVKAFAFFKRAAELGDADSDLFVAQMYLEGEGTELNVQEAVRRLKILVERKHSGSMQQMSRLYRIGMPEVNLPRNTQEADRLLELAAKMGMDEAEWEWGICLLSIDNEEGLNFLQKALAHEFVETKAQDSSPLKSALQYFIQEKNFLAVRLIIKCLVENEIIRMSLPLNWQSAWQDIQLQAQSNIKHNMTSLFVKNFINGVELEYIDDASQEIFKKVDLHLKQELQRSFYPELDKPDLIPGVAPH